MTDRERLIELISKVQYLGGLEEKVADHLFANGVNAVHVYSMNKPDVAAQIKANVSEIIK